MFKLIFVTVLIIGIVFIIRNRKNLPKVYQNTKNKGLIITKKLYSDLFKIYGTSSASKKKLFGQTNIQQGYDKNEALHSDKSLDPFKQSIAGQDAYRYSNNTQIVHSNSAFTQQHVLKQPKNPEVKTVNEEMGIDTKLDKNNITNIDENKINNPVYKNSSSGRMKI